MVKFFRIYAGFMGQFTEFVSTDAFPRGDWENTVAAIKSGSLMFKPLKFKRFGDMASFSAYNGFSQRFIDVLRDNDITNFTPHRIKTVDCNAPDYFYLVPSDKINRRYTSVELGKTYINLLPNLATDPIYFCLDDWNGSAFFGFKETVTLIATDKIVSLVKKHKLKNVRFDELEEVVVKNNVINLVKRKLEGYFG